VTEPATQLRLVPPPLPATIEDLLAQRKSSNKTLNDYVQDVHTRLWDNDQYRRLLEAVFDADAVEGSTTADDYEAADMIRKFARENKIPILAEKNRHTILLHLGVVLRRDKISRKMRKNMLRGEIVPGGDE